MTGTSHDTNDPCRVEDRAGASYRPWFYRVVLVAMLGGGIILGVWHHQIARRALWVFRNDEPVSSWLTILAGPLSTLPATLLAGWRRQWGAYWLIAGGLISLGAVLADEIMKGGRVAEIANAGFRYSTMISLPMIGVGLGFSWLQRHLERVNSHASRQAWQRLGPVGVVALGYVLLSLGAFFVADLPIFNNALETSWGFWIIPIFLGPLAMLAMLGVLGLPLYLAETVIIVGFLWSATTHERWRRMALLSALVTWLLSGLFLLAIVQWWG